MAIKVSDDYEVASRSEIPGLGEKYGIKLRLTKSEKWNEFYSDEIQYKGQEGHLQDCHQSYNNEDEKAYRSIRDTGEMIENLRCPDCKAQAFKTDHKNVAVCGDYPGWYFFYRRIDQDVQSKTKFVIKNGKLVEDSNTDKTSEAF